MPVTENSARDTATTLVIDSATEACSVALFDRGSYVAGDFRVLGRGHAEALVPMIAALPGKGRAGRIAVALGPGSFTGVRVGLATARALALAWGAQLIGYPTLALIAAMARDAEGHEAVGVAMTGGHGEWFVQGIDSDGRSGRDLASCKPADAVSLTTEALVAGNQAAALVEARGFGRALSILPDARSFLALNASDVLSDVHPLYGRAPDAKVPLAIS